MAAQEKVKKQKKATEEVVEDIDQTLKDAAATREEANERLAELDSLLDEIDEILIVNAEEFVGSFVQQGGE